METTFMTIHNLTPDANILFASESIVDITGYFPHEVVGRSSFDYYHPEDVPIARYKHQQSIKLDKAAVLHYARIRTAIGEYITCECVFTVVHDVLVACTSIYKANDKTVQREFEVKRINRLFSAPPRDPRYHMLEHLSPKFTTPPQSTFGEPRAALILNRFSRTLSIMYATNAVSNILGVTAEQIHGKSFYECIQENCLPDAIRCLEGAKANDSIAYLRFIYRDPRRQEDLGYVDREASQSSDSEDGGVQLNDYQEEGGEVQMEGMEQNTSGVSQNSSHPWASTGSSRGGSGGSTDLEHESANSVFDYQRAPQSNSSASSAPPLNEARPGDRPPPSRRPPQHPIAPFEVEAVISCTSDGLVVILRAVPMAQPRREPEYANGLFAAPWAADPILPRYHDAPGARSGGPAPNDFMNSIREVAVFAWSLTGINGKIASYSHGTPRGEAVPPTGFPIWDPKGQISDDLGPENQAARKWAGLQRTNTPPNGRKVPYQHGREEELLNAQKTFGNVPMDNATRQSYLPEQDSYASRQPNYSHPRHEYSLPRPASMEHGNVGRAAPGGNQGHDPNGPTNPIRDMWY